MQAQDIVQLARDRLRLADDLGEIGFGDRDAEQRVSLDPEALLYGPWEFYQLKAPDENRFRNHYEHCGQHWTDESPSTNNDRCPVCDKEIEPFKSEDL